MSIFEAFHGGEDYGEPFASLRVVAPLYPNMVHILVPRGSTATSLADVAGGRISVGAAGSGTEEVARQLLGIYGMTYDDVDARFLTFSESSASLRDGAIDAAIISVGYPGGGGAGGHHHRWGPPPVLRGGRVAALQELYPYYSPGTIPMGAYSGMDERRGHGGHDELDRGLGGSGRGGGDPASGHSSGPEGSPWSRSTRWRPRSILPTSTDAPIPLHPATEAWLGRSRIVNERGPSALSAGGVLPSPDLHYLNCAYMSPLPRVVEEAGVQGMIRKRNPAPSAPEDFFEESQEVRRLFAELVNVPDPNSVAIIPSVSYGIGVAPENTPLARGPEHRSSRRTVSRERLWLAAAGLGARGRDPDGGPGAGEEVAGPALEPEDPGGHRRGHGSGGHGAGPLDRWHRLRPGGHRGPGPGGGGVPWSSTEPSPWAPCPSMFRSSQPDALIVASYKWLLGPYSIGVAYFGPRYRGWRALGGDLDCPGGKRGLPGSGGLPGRVSARRCPIRRGGAEQLHSGSHVGCRPSGSFWSGGPDRIQAYTAGLSQGPPGGGGVPGIRRGGGPYRVGHIFGIRTPEGLGDGPAKEALRNEGVSASLRGSALRVSPHLYNDPRDVEALGGPLRTAAGRLTSGGNRLTGAD